MSEWVRCLGCGHVWDDANLQHEVCACIDNHGWRVVEQLDTMTLPLAENVSTNSQVVRFGNVPAAVIGEQELER